MATTFHANPTGYDTDDNRWQAVSSRVGEADGLFFYAVRTTGIYCRPGCPSRLPRRENVVFFRTPDQAEKAGFRPCRKCRPESSAPEAGQMRLIVQACRSMERSETQPTLSELADQAGLSPSYFQRLFSRIVGISPREYGTMVRGERFKNCLSRGTSVTEALHEAGFGSTSRAHDFASMYLGMLPSSMKRGASGESIFHGSHPCFLGWVLVAATARGICSILLGDDPDSLLRQLKEIFPKASLQEADPVFLDLIRQVVAFMEDMKGGMELPLDIRGTAFQQRVWNILRGIRPGETLSYSDVAARLGNPKAVRAVAGACAANRVAVAIPCHRVVNKDGEPGGYRWGSHRKQVLLAHEQAVMRNEKDKEISADRKQTRFPFISSDPVGHG